MSPSSSAFFLLLPLPSPALAYKAVKTQREAVCPELHTACCAMTCISSTSLGIPGTRASNLSPHYVLQCAFLKWTHFTGCFFCFTVPCKCPQVPSALLSTKNPINCSFSFSFSFPATANQKDVEPLAENQHKSKLLPFITHLSI